MEAEPSTPTSLLSTNSFLKDRWEILKKVGGGGFGEIYKAKDHSRNMACAVKVESCTSNKQVLKMEVAVLKRLQKSSSHVCEFLGCGRTDKVNYMVMTLLGPSLSELRKHQPHQRFSISTTLRTSLQILAAVQSMHDCGFLHRDIKPSNFAIGSTPATSRRCYMFDYGLARQYTTVTGEVRQPRQVAGFRGTVRYASLNAHLSRDLGRHDDLWSVFYLLVELAIGQLPWRRIRDKEEAGEFKAQFDHRKLICGLPIELGLFLDHIKALTYFDKPDYLYITTSLQKAIMRLGIQESDPLDWEQDLCGPSMTSASIVSTPGLKVVDGSQEAARQSMHKSRTNCSDVEELIEHSSANPDNEHDKKNKVRNIAQTDSSPDSASQKMQQVEKPQGIITLIRKESKGIENAQKGDILDNNVQIDNYYVSEEEEAEEEEEEESDRSEESSLSQETSRSQSSPAACNIHMITQSESSPQSNNQLVNGASVQFQSVSSEGKQDRSVYQSDSLKNKSSSSSSNQTRSMNTKSQSKKQSELSSNSDPDKNKESPFHAIEETNNNLDIHPDDQMQAIVGFGVSVMEQDEKGKETDKDKKYVGNAKKMFIHNIDPGTESSLSNSVGINAAHQQIASHPTLLDNFHGKGIIKQLERASMDTQMNFSATNSASNKCSKREAMASGKTSRIQEEFKRKEERPAVASVLSQGKLLTTSKGKDVQKKPPSSKSKLSASQKSKQTTGKLRKHGAGEEPPVKSPQDMAVLKAGYPSDLEVVPSPVVLQPRPPPNPPPQHYSRTLQARRQRFMRPHQGK